MLGLGFKALPRGGRLCLGAQWQKDKQVPECIHCTSTKGSLVIKMLGTQKQCLAQIRFMGSTRTPRPEHIRERLRTATIYVLLGSVLREKYPKIICGFPESGGTIHYNPP